MKQIHRRVSLVEETEYQCKFTTIHTDNENALVIPTTIATALELDETHMPFSRYPHKVLVEEYDASNICVTIWWIFKHKGTFIIRNGNIEEIVFSNGESKKVLIKDAWVRPG